MCTVCNKSSQLCLSQYLCTYSHGRLKLPPVIMMTPHSCVAVVVVLCLFRACYLKPFRQPSVRLNGESFRKIHPQQRDLPPVHSCLVVVLCLSPAHYSKPFSATAFLQYSTATKRNDERGECDFYQPTWKSVRQQYKYQPCHHACLGACRTHSSLRFGHNALPQQLGAALHATDTASDTAVELVGLGG